MTAFEAKLHEKGIELPPINLAAAEYIPYYGAGNLLFMAGQSAKFGGEMRFKGSVGSALSVAEGVEAARLCALNLLRHLEVAVDGDITRVKRCVRLCVFVNCGADFTQHAAVADGASAVMVQAFGEAGRHVRTSCGVCSLPGGSAVTVEAVFELTGEVR